MTRPTPSHAEAVAKLLPCPFCGGEAEKGEWPPIFDYTVMCKGCGANVEGESRVDADAAWNRRAPESTAAALLDAQASAREHAEEAVEEMNYEERVWPKRR